MMLDGKSVFALAHVPVAENVILPDSNAIESARLGKCIHRVCDLLGTCSSLVALGGKTENGITQSQWLMFALIPVACAIIAVLSIVLFKRFKQRKEDAMKQSLTEAAERHSFGTADISVVKRATFYNFFNVDQVLPMRWRIQRKARNSAHARHP